MYAVQNGNIGILEQLGSIHTHYGYAYHNYELIDTLLKQWINKKISLEMTSGVQRKDTFTTIPSYPILKHYKELGGENIVIGTCTRDSIGKDLEEAYRILQVLELNSGYFQKRKLKKYYNLSSHHILRWEVFLWT